MSSSLRKQRQRRRFGRRSPVCHLEHFESRLLLSGQAVSLTDMINATALMQLQRAFFLQNKPGTGPGFMQPIALLHQAASPLANSFTPSGFSPADLRKAYGVDQITFSGNLVGNGTGQTIAIIDAFDYPTALADLQAFDAQFGLPDPPSFRRVNQSGVQGSYPVQDTGWNLEEALDIEWAHAMAPAANIVLVEATDNSNLNLMSGAVGWARGQSDISVVTMSFGGNEFGGEGSLFDSLFTTPTSHTTGGITFLASTGDSGSPAGYPAYSPNVVAVGGTTLSAPGGNYAGETGWSGSGGGISTQESQPSYQKGFVTQSTTKRTAPDVSMDADLNSGVAVYSTPYGGWIQVGGTSLSSPLWAGLIAIANQGRTQLGLKTLYGTTDTLPALYNMDASNFHDILSGSNGGFSAGPGYDLVTGRGTPIANSLVPTLAYTGSLYGTAFQDNNGDGIKQANEPALAGASVNIAVSQNATGTGGGGSITSSGITSTINLSGYVLPVTDVNVTLNITHNRDSDLVATLTSPSGATITLFSHVGGSGHNFTGTVFDDQASTSINNGVAPFNSSSFQPVGLLSTFNSTSVSGGWKLKVTDTVAGTSGTLNSWSISISSAYQVSTTTDSEGHYFSGSVAYGTTYNLSETPPSGYIQTPTANFSHSGTLAAGAGGQNFGNFPTTLTPVGDTGALYLTLDPTHTYLQVSNGNAPLATPTYQVALSLLPSLSLNLLGMNNKIYVDFKNGSPFPATGLALNAPVGSHDALFIYGALPTDSFTMTDTTIGPTSQAAITFGNFYALTVDNATFYYTGQFATLHDVTIGEAANFYWSFS